MRIAFACSAHVGHLNPSLPLVKALVELGHEIHYLCFESARPKIEKAGAIFHDVVEIQKELYGECKTCGAVGGSVPIMEQQGLDTSSFLSLMKVANVCLEKELPGTLRFFRQLQPAALVYDPLMFCRWASHAAKVLGIPAVGLLTLAGPGAMREHSPATMRPLTIADLDRIVREFSPHNSATERLNDQYRLDLEPGLFFPDGYLDTCRSNKIIVTTSEDLQDPMTPDLARAYQSAASSFVYVGPLLSEASAGEDALVRKVLQARASGRSVVVVSMGTLIVSNHAVMGWHARRGVASITSKDLCQAAWGGTFDAFVDDDESALVIVAVGPQAHPLGDLVVPPSAVCVPSLPQVELLRAGIDVFVTHGGQNSFTEAMATGTAVVVCPGFGDQLVNAQKSVDLGVGLKVDQPSAVHASEDASAALEYRSQVCEAVRAVSSNISFKRAAEVQAEKLRQAGGLPRAVGIVIAAASKSDDEARAAHAGA
eukprot:TRINITY_DN47149_c0_g1_i1.p1 TRINITY_DN47149_c0_g1~~TRINITY_DN47149_c0_g1_i1.p1  ORF type:complete len:483 (-),score=102.59 TRINITY_DN47149_c0_g1_i1:320-1768(-)